MFSYKLPTQKALSEKLLNEVILMLENEMISVPENKRMDFNRRCMEQCPQQTSDCFMITFQ